MAYVCYTFPIPFSQLKGRKMKRHNIRSPYSRSDCWCVVAGGAVSCLTLVPGHGSWRKA
jgi:hypothetical protein